MTKFINIVRCKVKTSNRKEYLEKIDNRPKFDGMIQLNMLRLTLMRFL